MIVETLTNMAHNYNNSSDPHARKIIKRAISSMFNELPQYVSGVSEKAVEEANKMGLSLEDLMNLKWNQQTKYDVGRKILHWEHYETRSSLTTKLLENPELAEDLVKSNVTVWITKSEDKELTKNGYRSVREDTAQAYKQSGINMIMV